MSYIVCNVETFCLKQGTGQKHIYDKVADLKQMNGDAIHALEDQITFLKNNFNKMFKLIIL